MARPESRRSEQGLHFTPCFEAAASCVVLSCIEVLADGLPGEREVDLRPAQHPGDEGVAVRPRPGQIAILVRIVRLDVLQDRRNPRGLLVAPFGDDPRPPAAHAVVRVLEIAMHVAEALAARVRGLPHLPALAFAGRLVADDEPVVFGHRADERQGRAAQLDDHALLSHSMIAGLVRILFFQGLGELVSHFLLTLIPGPVVGLVLLLGWFTVRKSIAGDVDTVATALVQNLGLLFVPAAVGVVMFWPQLRTHAVAVVAALVVSAVLTIAVSALVLKIISKKQGQE